MSNEPTTTPAARTIEAVPAVMVSHDFLQAIETTIELIRLADIDGHLRRVFEVVLPEYRAVTADMSDGVYEVFTRVTRFEELHHELTHLARAARVALALGEGDLVYPDWMPREAIAADDAEVLKRARGTVAMFEDMARMMGESVEG
jgi:hypothetical protein